MQQLSRSLQSDLYAAALMAVLLAAHHAVLRDQASDSEEVVPPLMLDGTYLSRNFATLGP